MYLFIFINIYVCIYCNLVELRDEGKVKNGIKLTSRHTGFLCICFGFFSLFLFILAHLFFLSGPFHLIC